MVDMPESVDSSSPISETEPPPTPYERLVAATTKALELGNNEPLIEELKTVYNELIDVSGDSAGPQGYFRERDTEKRILSREVDDFLHELKQGKGGMGIGLHLNGVSKLLLIPQKDGAMDFRVWESSSQKVIDKWNELNPQRPPVEKW